MEETNRVKLGWLLTKGGRKGEGKGEGVDDGRDERVDEGGGGDPIMVWSEDGEKGISLPLPSLLPPPL